MINTRSRGGGAGLLRAPSSTSVGGMRPSLLVLGLHCHLLQGAGEREWRRVRRRHRRVPVLPHIERVVGREVDWGPFSRAGPRRPSFRSPTACPCRLCQRRRRHRRSRSELCNCLWAAVPRRQRGKAPPCTVRATKPRPRPRVPLPDRGLGLAHEAPNDWLGFFCGQLVGLGGSVQTG